MTDLDQLESQSVYILREAFNKIDRLALLWSIGKDSNVLLWLVRKAFFGKVPFPVVQLDTGMELPEVYEFRDVTARDWDLESVLERLAVVGTPGEVAGKLTRFAGRGLDAPILYLHGADPARALELAGALLPALRAR